jgi:hypothetical protein
MICPCVVLNIFNFVFVRDSIHIFTPGWFIHVLSLNILQFSICYVNLSTFLHVDDSSMFCPLTSSIFYLFMNLSTFCLLVRNPSMFLSFISSIFYPFVNTSTFWPMCTLSSSTSGRIYLRALLGLQSVLFPPRQILSFLWPKIWERFVKV